MNGVINIIAIIAAPIIAVWVGQALQDRSEKRKDKLQIFKVLMTARLYGWTTESVNAMNIIDVVYADDKDVRVAWHILNDKYHVISPSDEELGEIEKAHKNLLEAMAKALGYKSDIVIESIQNPYVPDGMVRQIEEQRRQQQTYSDALSAVTRIVNKH